MNASVRWMHSGMQGAPVIDNNWGALTAMLRACCVTGFNVRPIQSITCQGTKATIQCAGHGYLEHQVVQIENAVPAGYNGAHRVVSVEGANTLTIELEAELPEAQAAPGQTLQMRTAPLGWESLFDDGGQKLVLRSADPQSTQNVLRVDDSCPAGYTTTWAKFGRVTMAQNMSDLDTFVGARAPFDPSDPTKNEVPKGSGNDMCSGWFKWYYATYSNNYSERNAPSAGARHWVIAGDDKTCYPLLQPLLNVNGLLPWGWGDIDSLQSADAFASLLCAHVNDRRVRDDFSVGRPGNLGLLDKAEGRLLLRRYLGEGLPEAFRPLSLDVFQGTTKASGLQSSVPFPNGAGNGLLLHPAWLQEEGGTLRGRLRGLYHVLHQQNLGHLTVLDGVAGLPGRKVLLVNTFYGSGAGSVALDITGPW
ncbi:MAG: hypothetical protein Q4A28_07550 [Brachymonas sp.]|nr:hypothetical protein [Brachymonas sp.]